MKKEGRKAGHPQPRYTQRYGYHSGYSGPARTFRTFEYPTGPSDWRNTAARSETALPVVHPETAYDVAQEQGGNVALASFIENYETPAHAEMSSRADALESPSASFIVEKKSLSIKGASARAKEKKKEKIQEQSELDIFDELLASI